MPVGTKNRQLKIIEINELKLTNIKFHEMQKKETDTFFRILKIIGITAATLALSALGQAWVTSTLSAFGFSNLVVATTGHFANALIDFSISMGYSYIENNLQPIDIAFNLFSFIPGLGTFKRKRKISKTLMMADNLGLLENLHIDQKLIKNYNDVISIVFSRKSSALYNFYSKKNESKILNFLHKLSEQKGIKALSAALDANNGFFSSDLKNLVEFQQLLSKTNPKIFSKINSNVNEKTVDYLKFLHVKPKDLLNDNVFFKVIYDAQNNVSKNMVWTIYSLRITAEFDQKFTRVLLKNFKKINKFVENLSITKVVTKIVNNIFDNSEKVIGQFFKKVQANVAKNHPVVNKINLSMVKKFSKNVYRQASKFLIPINNSQWFLAYRVQPWGSSIYIVQLYFKEAIYPPQIFYLNVQQMAEWVRNCEYGNPDEYYKNNLVLDFSYYFNFSKNILSPLLPPIIEEFVNEGWTFYQQIKNLKREISQFPNIANIAKTAALNRLQSYFFGWNFGSSLLRLPFGSFLPSQSPFWNKTKIIKAVSKIKKL